MWLDPVTKLGQFVLNSYINEQNKMPLIPTWQSHISGYATVDLKVNIKIYACIIVTSTQVKYVDKIH